jgi:hypothetical protein
MRVEYKKFIINLFCIVDLAACRKLTKSVYSLPFLEFDPQ